MPSSSDQFPDPWNLNRPDDERESSDQEDELEIGDDDEFGLAELQALLSDGPDSAPSQVNEGTLDDLDTLFPTSVSTEGESEPDLDALLASLGVDSAARSESEVEEETRLETALEPSDEALNLDAIGLSDMSPSPSSDSVSGVGPELYISEPTIQESADVSREMEPRLDSVEDFGAEESPATGSQSSEEEALFESGLDAPLIPEISLSQDTESLGVEARDSSFDSRPEEQGLISSDSASPDSEVADDARPLDLTEVAASTEMSLEAELDSADVVSETQLELTEETAATSPDVVSSDILHDALTIEDVNVGASSSSSDLELSTDGVNVSDEMPSSPEMLEAMLSMEESGESPEDSTLIPPVNLPVDESPAEVADGLNESISLQDSNPVSPSDSSTFSQASDISIPEREIEASPPSESGLASPSIPMVSEALDAEDLNQTERPTSEEPEIDTPDEDSRTLAGVGASTTAVPKPRNVVDIPVIGSSTYKQILSGRQQISAFALVLVGMGGVIGYGWSKAKIPNPLQTGFNEPGISLFADQEQNSEEEQPLPPSSGVIPQDTRGTNVASTQSEGQLIVPGVPPLEGAPSNLQNRVVVPNIGGIDEPDSSGSSPQLEQSDVDAQTPPPIDISDVPPDHWARPYVLAMYEQGVIPDFPDGKFQPDKPVTRAELAASIQRAFKDQAGAEAIAFDDIPEQYWARDAITHAVNTGFMSGYSEDIFEPDQQIPRYQVLVSLVSGLGLEKIEDPQEAAAVLQSFPDLDAMPEWAFGQVAASENADLIINTPEERSSLSPNRPATRAEVSAMIYQALVNAGQIEDTVN